MRMLTRRSLALPLLLAPVLPARAQQTWVEPKPPCTITPGQFRVSTGVVDLKIATEQPAQRDHLLRQAQDVLTRAIVGDKQDKNPGAWYYLGRYYVESRDPAGADTAFARAQALAPQCAADIESYRARLGGDVMGDGLRSWQDGKGDSAVIYLRLAARVDPQNPRALFNLGRFFASQGQGDSANAYTQRAVQVAGNDTTYARDKKEALVGMARTLASSAQSSPALAQWRRTRASRDSVQRLVTADSGVLARMQASAAGRRARGARLAPADQRQFSHDSAGRAEALERDRAGVAGFAATAAADSAAALAAAAGAIAAQRSYLASYPDAIDVAMNLGALYTQLGDPKGGEAVLDSTFDRAEASDPEALVGAGERLVNGGNPRLGARALALGLPRRPYDRDALYSLASAYVGLRDSANALPTALRLVALDPMNRGSLRALASAYDLRGRRDSAAKYGALADSGVALDITVSTFVPDSAGYTISGLATNARQSPSRPLHLTFELLDAHGAAQGSQGVDVAAIQPGASTVFQVHLTGTSAAGWRYRSP